MKNSCTIIIPAYNEVGNISDAIQSVSSVIKRYFDTYTLIIVDDGSTDGTEHMVSRLERKNKHIRLIRHKRNLGLGRAVRDGISASKDTYVTVFPGDNDMTADSLSHLFRVKTESDLILAYPKSDRMRSILRRVLSHLFTRIVNTLFGLNLRYYNGPFVCRRKILLPIQLQSRGFSIYAEMKVLLIRSGASYKEVPFTHVGRKSGTSKALSLASIRDTFLTLVSLFRRVHSRRFRDE
jgi:glycosyltransferase involved in cell wall biosynthesis